MADFQIVLKGGYTLRTSFSDTVTGTKVDLHRPSVPCQYGTQVEQDRVQ